jgi:hypothetical protein
VQRSSVTQNAVNDNDYSFDVLERTLKKVAEDHNFVNYGNTIFRQWGNGLFATGYDVPNNSWDYADIALTTGILAAKQMILIPMTREGFRTLVECNMIIGKYLLSAMLRRDSSTKFGPGKVGYFPSFTAGWIISDEGFLEIQRW